jgi:hypothetical protein
MSHDKKHHHEHCHETSTDHLSSDELIAENLAVLSETVTSMGVTIEMLVQKTASMAYHVIATEEILAEIAAEHGLDLGSVNARIRSKMSAGTDLGNPDIAIDIAASIVSLNPRR